MRRTSLFTAALLLIAGTAQAGDFTVSSASFDAGQGIPDRHILAGFGCTGGNLSPQLSWSEAPEGTRSFAVTAYDPDAPTGSGWWHWVVFNLPADTTDLPEGAGSAGGGGLPAQAVESTTDFGQPGYGGPCPPEGDAPHRYVFTVHALGTDSLPLDASAPAAMVGYYLHANRLGTASLTATYGR